MNPRVVRQWMTSLGLIGGMALVLTGCPERADKITEFGSQPSWDFPVASAYIAPVGPFSLDGFAFAAFDPDLSTDAFGRGGEPLGFGFAGDNYTLDPAARNSTTDPRLPALGGLGTEVVGGNQCRFGDGPWWGGSDGWDFFCFLEGLKPNTDYTVMLARYALTVNGELDTQEMLLTGAITQPDALTLLGGTPGGYPLELCDFDPSRPTFTIGVTGSQNPLVMGFVTTDGAGALTFDCLVGSGGFWSPGTLSDPAEAPFAPNDQASFGLPRYNYVVVVEGTGTAIDPVPTGAHVMRFQVGVDIDGSGNPIANALAPLPDRAATPDELLFAPGGAGRPDSLTVTYNNLEDLVGGAEYEAWLVNPTTGGFTPAVGTYNMIKVLAERDPITGEVISTRDSIVDTQTGVSSFVGGNQADSAGVGFRHQLIVSDNTLPGGAQDSVGFYTHMLLTIAGSPGGASLPEARPFFFQYTDQGGTPSDFFDDAFFSSGNTSFGNFNMADPDNSRLYTGEGQGTGGFREDELVVEMNRLSRPPVGFELMGWVVDEDGNATGVSVMKGPAPERVDLSNADVEDFPGITTDNGILESTFRAFQDSIGVKWFDPNPPAPQCDQGEEPNPDLMETGLIGTNLRTFFIALEAKAGNPGMGYIPVQVGAVPPRITDGEPACVPSQ